MADETNTSQAQESKTEAANPATGQGSEVSNETQNDKQSHESGTDAGESDSSDDSTTTPETSHSEGEEANGDNPDDDGSTEQEASESDDDGSDADTPDWFMKDKYKTVEDQAKAYKDLSAKVGKNWGAPKDDYSVEGIEGVSKDDALVKHLSSGIKDLGLSQDGFNQLVKTYQEATVKLAEEMAADLTKTLTESDVGNYKACTKWMNDALNQEEIDQIKNNWLMTPEDFKLFNTLRLMVGPQSKVPSHTEGDAPRYESSTSVENDKIKYRKEVKQGLRVADKNYESQLAQRFKDARTREIRSKG